MKRLLKEPLLHFLILGTGLFITYGLMPHSSSDRGPEKILITQGDIEHLASGFARAWQRPPTPDELAGLVRDRVREEVYCREAIAMGLDKDDTIIRRRLRQKLEFVSADITAMAKPTDAELDAYFRAHADTFRLPQRFTFSQVYLNPQLHGDAERLRQDARSMLAQLERADAKNDLAVPGDAFLLDREFENVSAVDIGKQFGDKFATKLSQLAPGHWQGPVESGYGMHLVLVKQRTEAQLPALVEVREAVLCDCDNARRLEGNEAFYKNLLKHYTVVIETAEPAKEPKKLAELRK